MALKEVTKEEAVMAALNEQDTFLIYQAIDGYKVENLRLSLAHILQPDTARFVTDVPEEKPAATTSSGQKKNRQTKGKAQDRCGKDQGPT